MFLKINGDLVAKNMIELASYSASTDETTKVTTKTLTLTLNGIGEKKYSGDEAEAVWKELQKDAD